MEAIRRRLTRVHLWIGEMLGLTRYTSCWRCEHSRVIEESPDICGCVATEDDRECTFGHSIACCAEAVWCEHFNPKEYAE